MSQEERIKELEAKLENVKKIIADEAAKTAHGDDEELYESGDPWGGNMDDAFAAGEHDGSIFFARSIIKIIEKEI